MMLNEIQTIDSSIRIPTANEAQLTLLFDAIQRKDVEEFSRLLDLFDLNAEYHHERFPEPKILVMYLLQKLLNLGGFDGPIDFSINTKLIDAILDKNPNLEFELEPGYSFLACLNEWRNFDQETLEMLRSNDERLAEEIKHIPDFNLTEALIYFENQIALYDRILNHYVYQAN